MKTLKDKSLVYNYKMTSNMKNEAIKNGLMVVGYIKEIPPNCYAIAWNRPNQSGKITYLYFYSEDLNKITYFLKLHYNSNLFQVINNEYVKPYIDIDKPHLLFEELGEFCEKIFNKFNEDFNTKIPREDFIILYRPTENNIIDSIHLIINNVNIKMNLLRWWVENKITGFKKDLSVYPKEVGKNQVFCDWGQTKYGSDSNPFEDFDSSIYKRENEDYFINKSCDEVIETHKDYIQYLEDIENTSIEEKIKKKQPNKNDPNTIIIDKYNMGKCLLNELPEEFFRGENKDWSNLVRTMKVNNVKNMDEYLSKSAGYEFDPPISPPFEPDDNKSFYKDIVVEEVKFKNMKKAIVYINEKYDKQFYYDWNGIYDTDDLRDWIEKNTGINKLIINNCFNTANESEDPPLIIQFSKDCYLNLDNYELTTPTETYNYLIYMNKLNYKSNTENFIKSNKLVIAEKAKQFLYNDNKVFAVKMAWGEGKSHLIMTPVIKECIENGKRCVLYTENNSLNTEVYEKYKDMTGVKIWCHQKHSEKSLTKYHNVVICSMESNYKIDDFPYEIVILDEYETIISHMESNKTFSPFNTNFESVLSISKKIKKADKTFLLDADLSNERITPLLNYNDIDIGNVELYESDENKWRNLKNDINIYTDADQLSILQQITKDLDKDKRLAIGFLSVGAAETYFEYIKLKYPHKRIFTKWGGLEQYHINNITNILDEDTEATYSINKKIDDKLIDVWIYTPSVLTGISYDNKNWFHKTYLITNDGSCNARLCIQMLFRVRYLIDEEINIHTKTKPKFPSPTDEQILTYLQHKISWTISSINLDCFNFDIKYNLNELYKKLKIVNTKENFKSLISLGNEIIRILSCNHKIDIKFKALDPSDGDYEILTKNMKRSRKIAKQVKAELYSKVKLLNYKDEKSMEQKVIIKSTNYIGNIEIKKKQILRHLGLKQSYYRQLENIDMDLLVLPVVPIRDFNLFNNNDNKTLKCCYSYEIVDGKYKFKYENTDRPLFNEKDGGFHNGKKIKMNENILDKENYNQYKLKQVEYFDKTGIEYINEVIDTDNKNNPIYKTNAINYQHFIHNNPNLFKFLLDKERMEGIELINNYNKFCYEEKKVADKLLESKEMTSETEEQNLFNLIITIVKQIFSKNNEDGSINTDTDIINEDNTINYKNYYLSGDYFDKAIIKNKDMIEKNYNKLMELDSVIKKDIQIDITKDNNKLQIYYFIKRILHYLGLELTAPEHKKRKNAVYSIIPNTLYQKNLEKYEKKNDNLITITRKSKTLENGKIEYYDYLTFDNYEFSVKTKKNEDSNLYSPKTLKLNKKTIERINKERADNNKIPIKLDTELYRISKTTLSSNKPNDKKLTKINGKIKKASLDTDVYSEKFNQEQIYNNKDKSLEMINNSILLKEDNEFILRKNKLNDKIKKDYYEFFKKYKIFDYNYDDRDKIAKKIYTKDRYIHKVYNCEIDDEEDEYAIKELSKEKSLALDKGVEEV